MEQTKITISPTPAGIENSAACLLKFLVVEDDASVCRKVIHRMGAFPAWESIGYTLDAEGAIRTLRTHRPALLFLDWELVDGNAFDVMDAVRAMPGYRPYVVFFTGFTTEKPHIPERMVSDYGVDKYLTKPISEKLSTLLPGILEAAAARAAGNLPPSRKVWLTDSEGVRRGLDFSKLLCAVQHPVEVEKHRRLRDLFFTDAPAQPVTLNMGWEDLCALLDAEGLDYFRASWRSHLVVRSAIDRYERPRVRLRGMKQPFDVTAEKHTEFERWLAAGG